MKRKGTGEEVGKGPRVEKALRMADAAMKGAGIVGVPKAVTGGFRAGKRGREGPGIGKKNRGARAKVGGVELEGADGAAVPKWFDAAHDEAVLKDLGAITGNAMVDAKLWRMINSSKKSNSPIAIEEVRVRVHGDGIRGGIRGLNRSFRNAGTPWHCTTIYRLCELLLEWGQDAAGLIRGEFSDVCELT